MTNTVSVTEAPATDPFAVTEEERALLTALTEHVTRTSATVGDSFPVMLDRLIAVESAGYEFSYYGDGALYMVGTSCPACGVFVNSYATAHDGDLQDNALNSFEAFRSASWLREKRRNGLFKRLAVRLLGNCKHS